MAHHGVKAVLFDFGLVLSGPPLASAWLQMHTHFKVEDDRFHAIYWNYRDDYDRGTISGTEYWHHIATDADTTLSDADVIELKRLDVELWTDMNEPMLAWVHRLQAANIRTGVLSNIGDAMAEGICAKFTWTSKFTHCVWSHALKMRKPEPEIYAEAVKGLGVEASQILFIDDRAENIRGAKEAGMQGLIYSKHADFEAEMRVQGYSDLLEI